MPTRPLVKPLVVLIAWSLAVGPVFAQERFSLFVPTPHSDVERMVGFADLKDGDFVVDLGSGDGRIVLEAVRRHPGVRGRGVEINEKLVVESREQAKAENIADRVDFLHQNAFDADLGEATVIFLWLFPELMRLLRPKILREARPGTRVITRTWDLGTWPADAVLEDQSKDVFMWIVPAQIEGNWDWQLPVGGSTHTYSAVLEQKFQKAEGVVRVGKRRNLLENMTLSGEEISFTLDMTVDGIGRVNHQFQGRVRGETIEGTVHVQGKTHERGEDLPWRATRVPRSLYFAPTGVDID